MDEVSSAQLRWRMQFKDLPNYKVDEQKEVAIGQTEMEPWIQTDKAWYTPGQLVRFRILRLNHRLRAILDPVRMNQFILILILITDPLIIIWLCGYQISRIWVEDPTGTAVAQWIT